VREVTRPTPGIQRFTGRGKNRAGFPFTVTEEIVCPTESRSNRDNAWVAFARIVTDEAIVVTVG
jgi:hypothetical protein